jgi:Protein of unknown function, DUF547
MKEISMFNRMGNVQVFTLVAFATMALAGPTISSAATTPDTAAYTRVLERFVTGDARVRYAELKADPHDLDGYLASIASVNAAELEARPEADRIAFWINAYNAITLKTITNDYPIQGHGLSALRYPSSSIRQISDAWSDRSWVVAGSSMSLDDIEHKTLRKRFREPRVHMALVCAALGCPPLRAEAYVGARLGEQLDDQTRRYLASPFGMKLEPEHRRIEVSAIFKWFAGDFDKEDEVRGFLIRYAPTAAARAALADSKTKIVFIDYDWSLNEAQGE